MSPLGSGKSWARLRSLIAVVSVVFFSVLAVAACADDGSDGPDTDLVDSGRADVAVIDAGGSSSGDSASVTDTGASDTGSSGTVDSGAQDTGPADTTPPGKVTNLLGTPKSPTAVDLTWNAPADDPINNAGTVAAYELRYATTPITNVAEFQAAVLATAPAPAPPTTAQNATVTGLLPSTTYHFVIRARDAAGNFGDLSNEAIVTTKARAKLLLTEVAVANTDVEGFDFVEAIATQAGSVDGIEIKQLGATLYTLGSLEVAVNDRIVVHASGTLPAGALQEDTTKSKISSTAAFASVDAFDVYSTTSGLTGTDNLITINDGTVVLDALAISNRDGDAAAATMTAWAAAKTGNTWAFSVVPADTMNDCETQRDAVNIAQPQQDPACGGFATGYAKGQSIHRLGTTDTNTKADWYLAGQTPGGDPPAPPTFAPVSAIAKTATTIELTFDHEIDAATVAAAAFSLTPALNVTNATLTNVNVITLTTAAQSGGTYQIDIASTLKSTAGSQAFPTFIRLCAFSALPALVSLNEVSPDLTNGADLIELKVTRGGALINYEVRANPTAAGNGTLLATLPAICAADNDIVVVHLTPVASSATETLSKSEQPHSLFVANYDSAYDVRGANTGIGFTNQVIAVRNAAGAYIDAAVFSTMAGGASSATFLASVPFVQGLGLWLPANCGGASCTDATTPTIKGISANWNGVSGDDPGNPSIARTSTANQASSWVVGPSTFGN